jgi:hydrogenase maturation protein HypF
MTPLALADEDTFHIVPSVDAGEQDGLVPPDVGTCALCRREFADARDRRFRYPFVNCTHCGPRYSIIRQMPYDRANTTMVAFAMCPACAAEYREPRNRRFHAQPNACPACGPALRFVRPDGSVVEGDPAAQCAERLEAGAVIAIMGLGGFHLACRADCDQAVQTLRVRKHRDAKPLALMVPSVDWAERLATVGPAARALLESWRRPIVLLPKRPDAPVSAQVAPGCDCLGIMLPYTPLHDLLFAHGLGPLVMTSGNAAEEPLCHTAAEGLRRLGPLADGLLLHNREIERPIDDSVIMVFSAGNRARVVPVRRARGYVPEAVLLNAPAPRPILAVGGDLKSVFCLVRRNQAVLSEHLGDLANPLAFRNFLAAIERLERLTRIEPEVVAFDLHPGYHSSQYARRLGLPQIAVQHHHAHLAACMAEHGLRDQRVVGLAADGTGYGSDGHIWGCEVAVCDVVSFRRLGHLRYVPLLGGEAAARETWRPAVALLRDAFGPGWQREMPGGPERTRPAETERLEQHLAAGHRFPLTSSLGRLFDGVAFLLGFAAANRFEAQAAMALEAAAASGVPVRIELPFRLGTAPESDLMELDPRPLVQALVRALRDGTDPASLAHSFHRALAGLFAEALRLACRREAVGHVVLSGGCFLNRLLVQMLVDELAGASLRVHIHELVPPGDGGLALGQAAVAAATLAQGACPPAGVSPPGASAAASD